MYHFPILWFTTRVRDLGVVDPYAKPVIALISFIGTLLVASLSYLYLEKPLLNLKDRFFALKPERTQKYLSKVSESDPS